MVGGKICQGHELTKVQGVDLHRHENDRKGWEPLQAGVEEPIPLHPVA